MNDKIRIKPLKNECFKEAVDLVFDANLDTREEIEHHLRHTDAHWVAKDNDKIIGVIGWYQDNVNYANEAMGAEFPGTEAYWVGFFAVDKTHRGKGVGIKLLLKLENALKTKGVNSLWVSSVPQTKEYYERQGFQLVKEGEINGNQKFFLKKNI